MYLPAIKEVRHIKAERYRLAPMTGTSHIKRKRIVRGRFSHGIADHTLRYMTVDPIITPIHVEDGLSLTRKSHPTFV